MAKGSLKLGVAESMVMNNPEHAGDMLEMLRGAGAELVLDDFCAGYSSLLYLGRLPVEAVRIDRMLLDGNGGSDSTAGGMLRAVTAMTHELGRKVMVQSVETDEDVAYLRSIECEYGQGFYYGDPIAERDVLQLLKLVRKSEQRIEPRGLFRAPQRKKRKDETTEVAAKPEAVPQGAEAMAAAVPPQPASPPAQVPPPPAHVPAAARAGDPTTEPLRRKGPPDVKARPRGPIPAAAAAPPRTAPVAAPQPIAGVPRPPIIPTSPPSFTADGPIAGFAPMPPVASGPLPPEFPAPAGNAAAFHPRPAFTPPPPSNFAEVQLPPSAAPVQPFRAEAAPAPLPAAEATLGLPAQSAPPPARPVTAQPAQPKKAPTTVRPQPNYDKLPPNIAASLQRLAGVTPKPDSDAAE